MSIPSFDEETCENSSEHGTCYTFEPSDDVPASGRVFLDMAEHILHTDDGPQRRPKVVFRFFGLSVHGRWLGAPVSTASFFPNWVDHRPGVSMLSLGEPGHLVIDLGRVLAEQPAHIQQAVDSVVTALAQRFLTDLRVARYRHDQAAQRCESASRAHELAAMRKDITRLRYRRARLAADEADALLAAVRIKTHS
ncbi:hypothetical protein ACIP5Y_07140 [Nocardia sp. NPDC088792]|uniref:hypothetical protein n=1 Tax=Nocardia sp. NPDC088792 TaxID=3364332 RepID=UPI00381256BB